MSKSNRQPYLNCALLVLIILLCLCFAGLSRYSEINSIILFKLKQALMPINNTIYQSMNKTLDNIIEIQNKQFVLNTTINTMHRSEPLLIINHEHKLIFCPVAKNGVSSIKIFFHRLMGHKYWKTQLNMNHYAILLTSNSTNAKHMKLTRGLTQLQYNNKFIQLMNNNTYTKFTVIRDPLNRLLSAYLDKCVSAPFEESNRICKGHNQPDIMSFNNFVEHRLIIGQQINVNKHFRPQIYICDLLHWISKYHFILHHIHYQQHMLILTKYLNLTQYYYGIFDRNHQSHSTHVAHNISIYEMYYNTDNCKILLHLYRFYEIDYKMLQIEIPPIVLQCLRISHKSTFNSFKSLRN
eukprot:1305_1